MQNLRTLAFIAAGAFVTAAIYAGAVGDRGVDIDFETEDGRAVTHVTEGERGEFRFQDDDVNLEAHWRGDFTLTPTGDDITELDSKLSIELEENAESEKAVFEHHRDGVRKRYFHNGEEKSKEDVVNDGASQLFVRFLRVSGLEAEERVGALLDSGDTAAVVSEISALESDLAIRRYVLALSEQRSLSSSELTQLAQSLKGIKGDQDLRLALGGLLDDQTADAQSMTLLLEAAQNMESSHDIRKLLESAASGSVDDNALRTALQLYARIEGDHDLRKAAEALLENDGLTPQQKSLVLLAAVQRIEGNRDIRVLLEETAAGLSDSAELTAAWLDGFNSLESARDQRLSIEKAASVDQEPQLWRELIERTARIDDDRERRQALEAIAGAITDTPTLTENYRQAAAAIDDERERERALNALDAAN